MRAGALWADVTGPAAAYGLAPLAGSAGDVGVVGYTLGGGLSWLGRKHGLACNSVVAIELVTADGRHVRVDAARDPELFWALRGGGAQFGVVTAIEFELYPVEELHGGALMWPVERAEEIFAAWRDWTATVPDEVTSLCRIVNAPGGPSFVVVEAAILGDAAILAPLRALEPDLDVVRPMSPAELIEIHNDPKEPVPGMPGHRLLAGAPDEAIAELVAHASTPLVAVELRHLGGALGRTSVCHGALAGLHGEFSLFAVGIVPDAEAAMTVDVALGRLTQAMAPWDAGRAFRNFSDRRARFFATRAPAAAPAPAHRGAAGPRRRRRRDVAPPARASALVPAPAGASAGRAARRRAPRRAATRTPRPRATARRARRSRAPPGARRRPARGRARPAA